MYQLQIEIDAFPKSLNKKLRGHWGKNHRENCLWDTLIFQLVRYKLPPAPLSKAKIKIVRHFWAKMDFDGLVGSLKPVIDALVTSGVIKDDRWDVLGAWEVDQVFRAKKLGPLLQIEITERLD